MRETDILLCGLPRSGTTLACNLLNQLPETVALHEPMRVREFGSLADYAAVCQAIGRFCDEQRATLRAQGLARSKQVAGAVPTNTHSEERPAGGLRQSVVSGGALVVDKPLSPDFLLVVKHISAFAAILGEAVHHFPVYALVRNPLATLASWNSIDFGFRQGRAAAAERLDPALAARLAAIPDDYDRQLALLSWFHEQFQRNLPERAIIRYESLIDSHGHALSVIQPSAAELSESLQSYNLNPLYDRASTLRIGERLLRSEGAYWDFYPRSSVESLLQQFDSATSTGAA